MIFSSSKHISILRRHVAHLGLFVLGQSDVVALCAASILRDASDEVQDTGNGAQADEGDTDAVTLVEKGLGVRGCKAVTRNDTTDL